MRTIQLETGFTLIDVLIGMSLFAVAILGVLKMQIAAMQYQGSAKMRSQATVLAEQQMEELLSSTYGGLADGSRPGSPYQVRWTVSDQGDFKKMTVQVEWHDGGTKSVFLDSIRGDLH